MGKGGEEREKRTEMQYKAEISKDFVSSTLSAVERKRGGN
jgi:hypothetical protein